MYVPGLSAADAPAAPPGEAVKLSANENPLGPSPLAVEAMTRAAWEAHRYPDSTCRALRRALSERMDVPAEQIVVSNGADSVFTLVAQAMLEPGTPVAIPATTFATYEIAARVARADVWRVPMAGWSVDAGALSDALRRGARMAFVANPNNPTGTLLGPAELDLLVRAVPEGGLLILDEAYVEFAGEAAPDSLALVRDGAPVLVVRTFSKAYALAGLRVGYAVGPRPVIDALWRVREVFATSRLAEAAALAALGDEAHLRRGLELVRAGRRQIYSALDRMGIEYVPSHANFVWIRTGVSSSRLVPELARRGVLVRPGDYWGAPDWIRVTVGTAAQNDRFVRALEEALSHLPAAAPGP